MCTDEITGHVACLAWLVPGSLGELALGTGRPASVGVARGGAGVGAPPVGPPAAPPPSTSRGNNQSFLLSKPLQFGVIVMPQQVTELQVPGTK